MRLRDVEKVVGGVPFMTLEQAERITALMLDNDCHDVIELGFMHGVSTCYMAAALDATGKQWSITTIDLESARQLAPNVEDLLTRFGLRGQVSVYYEQTSYIWRLLKLLEDDPTPRFDFCYIDGAHNWPDDGFAFFLVDRLLKPGGWIVFDDIQWSYATSPSMSGSDLVRAMPHEQRTMQQVKKVFDVLVKQHPCYGEFAVHHGWGFARKLPTAPAAAAPLRREFVIEQVGLGAVLRQAYRRAKKKARRARPAFSARPTA